MYKLIKDINLFTNIDFNKCKLISIDGINGSGKSTLSSSLFIKQNIFKIDIDDNKYFITDCLERFYINCIKYNKLRNDINQAFKNNNLVICNSVCVLDILSRLDLSPDFKIYCKKLSEDGKWEDHQYFDYNIPLEKRFQKMDNAARIISQIEGKNNYIPGSSDPLLREIIRYHYRLKPDLNCDIVYTWRETAG